MGIIAHHYDTIICTMANNLCISATKKVNNIQEENTNV